MGVLSLNPPIGYLTGPCVPGSSLNSKENTLSSAVGKLKMVKRLGCANPASWSPALVKRDH